MKASQSIITILILAISGALRAAAPPNDSILKALKLPDSCLSLPGQNLDLATADAMDPPYNGASAGKSLWYCVPLPAMSGKLHVTIKSTTASGVAALFEVLAPEMGSAVLDHGSLMNALTKVLAISPKNAISAPLDSEKLKLAVNPATGMITGSFIPPGKTKPLPITGVLHDLPSTSGFGQGFFFDGIKGGSIKVAKP